MGAVILGLTDWFFYFFANVLCFSNLYGSSDAMETQNAQNDALIYFLSLVPGTIWLKDHQTSLRTELRVTWPKDTLTFVQPAPGCRNRQKISYIFLLFLLSFLFILPLPMSTDIRTFFQSIYLQAEVNFKQ